MNRLLAVFFLLAPLMAFANTEEGWIYDAQQALRPFKMKLKSELKQAFQEGGPVKAVNVCSIKASEITEEHQNKVVSMGRSSHKLRNPKNAPEPWMKKLLNEWKETRKRQAAKPVVVDLNDDVMAYAEPIYVEGLCVQCHGGIIDPKVEEILKEKYPKDQARRFRQDDFRGLFWVKMKK